MSKYEIAKDSGNYKALLYSMENGKWLYSGISYNFKTKRQLKKFLKSEKKYLTNQI